VVVVVVVVVQCTLVCVVWCGGVLCMWLYLAVSTAAACCLLPAACAACLDQIVRDMLVLLLACISVD
jgi:hypothetical protein